MVARGESQADVAAFGQAVVEAGAKFDIEAVAGGSQVVLQCQDGEKIFISEPESAMA